MFNIFQLLFGLILLFSKSESAKILGVFPTPSISHQVVFRPLMLELAKRGHSVTVITTDPAYPRGQAPQNLIEIDVHDISYAFINSIIKTNKSENDPLTAVKSVSDFFSNVFEIQLKSSEVQKVIQDNKQFDLLFIESCIRPALIFSFIYKAPVIEISSLSAVFSTYDYIGAATHPIIYPNPLHRRLFNLTLWEKITELYTHYLSDYIYMQHVHSENEMLKTIFGPNVPDLNDLRKNVHMLFVNVHPFWDFNRPVPPNVLYLGGMHQKPERELPKDLMSYLNSSKTGVIYMSFGTNVKPSLLPPETIKIFTNVFSELPYNVLWKWDVEELPSKPDNVRISKWLPQSDLLRHPNVKLFITQGGLQSTDEAITASVPLIGIPFHADQWFNVEQYTKFNIGVQLLKETLSEENLSHAIKTAFDNERFRQNLVKIRKWIIDQPQSPLDRAVWWTEYVIRHSGAEHLRAVHTSWAQYYELELILLLLGAFIILFAVTVIAIHLIVIKVKYYLRLKVKVH